MAKKIFLCNEVSELLCNKFVVVIGDSVQRGIYKDLVLLLQKNTYLTNQNLRNKGEVSFENDKLIEGGQKGRMTNGTSYREVRQYRTDHHLVRFYFVTRCYNKYVRTVLADLGNEPQPDVVIMNSCLWDISRYGPSSIEDYKKNLKTLFARLNEVVPEACLLIWNTTMPISKNARGGFLIPEIAFMNSTLRLDILEANFYAAKIAVDQNCDVLDLHYYLRHQMSRRVQDGVHWDMLAHRIITNLILSHITDAWGVTCSSNKRQAVKKEPDFKFGLGQNRDHQDTSREQNCNSSLGPDREHQGTGKGHNWKFGLGQNRDHQVCDQGQNLNFGMGPTRSGSSHRLHSNESRLSDNQNFAFHGAKKTSMDSRRGRSFHGMQSSRCYYQELHNFNENNFQARSSIISRARHMISNMRFSPYSGRRHR
ncbi:PC-esterase domain-containing protein 1A-like [Gigantopelta aegis]|uniref:PC-esterase domain-containing protein 1A-like n=1 Tax=Gigantopelta aegis TaxID=1735272 RepID=UPI001B889922|nr:PC-esterase domain-containing protein 1A-like [Gigantopelta aegis]